MTSACSLQEDLRGGGTDKSSNGHRYDSMAFANGIIQASTLSGNFHRFRFFWSPHDEDRAVLFGGYIFGIPYSGNCYLKLQDLRDPCFTWPQRDCHNARYHAFRIGMPLELITLG